MRTLTVSLQTQFTNMALILRSYLHVKGDYRSEDLNKAAAVILEIVLNCQHSSAAQVFFASHRLCS